MMNSPDGFIPGSGRVPSCTQFSQAPPRQACPACCPTLVRKGLAFEHLQDLIETTMVFDWPPMKVELAPTVAFIQFQYQTLPFEAKLVSEQLGWLPICSSGPIIPHPEAGLSFVPTAECCHSERAHLNRDNLRDPRPSQRGQIVFCD